MSITSADGRAADGVVGRGAVLAELHQVVMQVRAGSPRLVALLGEPGIGKTAVLRAFLGQLDRRDEVVLGSAVEDAGIPYLALASLFARLGVDPAEGSDGRPEEPARVEWRLCRDVAGGLVRRGRDRLFVAAIDDVHWADEAALRLLDHVTSSLVEEGVAQPVSCLVVLSGRIAFEQAAARRLLQRVGDDPAGRTIVLDGLDETGVAELVRQWTGRQPDPTEARHLTERTGGNPLLVRMVAARPGERLASPDVAGALSLSDELDRRLGTLMPAIRRVVELAAVHGEPVPDDVIAHASDADAPTHLRDAAELGLVVHDGRGWCFTHPEIARHLRLTLAPDDLRRRHAAVAAALLATGAGDEVLAIDHHLARAGNWPDPVGRWQIAAAAGRQALALGAWSRAVDAYRAVLPHVDDLPIDDLARVDLVEQAATALIMDSQPAAAVPVLTQAITLAERAGATEAWGRVVILAVRNHLSGPPPEGAWPEVPALRAFAEQEGDPASRARAWVTLADVAFVAGDATEGLRCCAEARRLALLSGDRAALAMVDYAEGLQHLGRLDGREACRRFEACGSRLDEEDDPVLASWWKVRLPIGEYLGGRLTAAEGHLAAAVAHARSHERWADQSLAEAYRACVATARGRFGEAEARAEEALRLQRRTGYPPTAAVVFPQLVCTRALVGDTDGVSEVVAAAADDGVDLPGWLTPLAATIRGEEPPYRPSQGPGRALTLDINTLPGLVARAELAAHGDQVAVARVATALQLAFERGAVWTGGWVATVPRALARTAWCLGDLDGAARWLALAGTAAADGGADAEAVQVLLRTAEVHRARGDREGARAASSASLAALETAETIGATALAAAARRALEAREGRAAPALGTGMRRTLLFTDIEGSTDLNVAVGDDRFVALLEEHNQILRSSAERHGGAVFHNTGDGYGMWFGDPGDALDCAVVLHRSLRLAAERHPDQAIRVRIGIATGTPVGLEGDLFGVDVVRAARLCSLARPGQAIIDQSTADERWRRPRVPTEALGPVRLKGFPAPEPAFRVDLGP